MSSLLIFVVQLYSFSLLALFLHAATPRIGLAPLLFLLAGTVGLLNVIELNGLAIDLGGDLVLRPGGHIFVPLSLLIILILYVVHGTRPGQIAVAGIIGVNFLVFATLVFLSLYAIFPAPDAEITGMFADNAQFDLMFMRGMLASITAFAADMLIMIVVYQGINNNARWIPDLIVPGIALTVALWTDSIVYTIGAFVGTEMFSFTIPGDILIKTLAGVALTPLIGWYLTRFAAEMPDYVGPDKRQTLSIFFRSRNNDARVESLESELRISRSIYNQLTQHIEEIFWLLDVEERRFLYVSPAYERITQFSVDALYDDMNDLLRILYDDEHQYTEEDLMRFVTTERDIEFRIKSPGGMIRWLRARAFPIKDEHGTIIRYAGIAEDITERKYLTEQQFELAVARQRMQILHDFIRDASHDLKTPISAIVLKLSVLEKIKDEDRRREIRAEVRERALHLSELITDMFTLSMLEGHNQVEMAEIDLNEIVSGAIQDTKMLAEDKGLSFEVELTGDDTRFTGNDEQIHRVASNLISNAIRYTESGAVYITTAIENEALYLIVRDTGIGIPQDSLHLVFERFFRTSRAKETQEGTGLGLAICKAIADKHNGEISVDSVEDEGTTFTLRIPQSQDKPLSPHDVRRSTQEIRAIPSDA